MWGSVMPECPTFAVKLGKLGKWAKRANARWARSKAAAGCRWTEAWAYHGNDGATSGAEVGPRVSLTQKTREM